MSEYYKECARLQDKIRQYRSVLSNIANGSIVADTIASAKFLAKRVLDKWR